MKPYSTNCCDLPGQTSLYDSLERGASLGATELLPTDLSMRNTGECPNADAEYTLAAILVENPPTRYFLSVRAMDGILSRASRRGKQLPELLVTAIAGMKEWWRKNPLVQNDLSATLATHQDQTVFAPARDKCLPVNMMLATRCKALGRGTGLGVGDIGEPQYTITAGHEHAVAYSFDSLASNSMKSGNPHSGCREVTTEKTLDCGRPDPNRKQGGIAIIQKGNEREKSNWD